MSKSRKLVGKSPLYINNGFGLENCIQRIFINFFNRFHRMKLCDQTRELQNEQNNPLLDSVGDRPPQPVHIPQDALTGPGIPHQARAFNTFMHGGVS